MSEPEEITMEEISKLTVNMVDLAEKFFLNKGTPLNNDQSDSIFDPLLEVLEKLAGYPDYSSYN